MTELYRHFDREGVLLYVGMSISTITRLRAHKSTSHWFEQIVVITIERFESHESCVAAEKAAIKNENPLFNKKCVPKKHNRCTPIGQMSKRSIASHIGITIPTLNTWINTGRFAIAPIPGTQPRRWRVADIETVWGRKA